MLEKNDFVMKQIIFLFASMGDKVSFRNDNIIIITKDGTVKYQSSCYRLFAIFIIGDTSITTGIIRRAHKFGFVIYLMTASFKLYSIIGNRMEGNSILHRKQYLYDSEDIARYLVYNKVLNQRRTLEKIRKKVPATKDAISILDEYIHYLADENENTKSLLGIEGSAARVYFPVVFDNVAWKGRKPRIKCDWINSALDIGYTILFNIIDSLLQVYGFDVYCGVYHKEFYMRKSLVCDIMEPFRPLIDYRLRVAINLNEITEDDFKEYNHQYQLSYEKNAKIIQIFMEPILERKEDIFLYIQSYYRCFMKRKDISQYKIFEV